MTEPELLSLPATDSDGNETASSRKPVITIVHASVGSGHRAAANAVAAAFNQLKSKGKVPNDVEVEVLDILDYGRIIFDGNKTAAAFTGASRPIYDVTWRYTLTGRILWGGGSIWSRVMFPRFNDYIREKQPLAVICTHITAANVAAGARMITGIDYPLVCIPTDYEIEGLWPHKEADLFCVATEFMAETLRPRKVDESHIKITGIPVRPGFGDEPFSREEVLRRFNLPDDRAIVLVMAGASLPQPYVRFRAAMEQTLPYLRRFQHMHFVFLPGKDIEYSRNLKAVFQGMKLDNATVLDFVDDMASLMRASDLAIMKSGGLSITECLCAKLPMLLVGKSYGQEKANTTMLSSFGASLHATTARELVSTLDHIHEHPEVLDALLINADALRRPQAAEDIANATMDLVGLPQERARYLFSFYLGDKPAHVR